MAPAHGLTPPRPLLAGTSASAPPPDSTGRPPFEADRVALQMGAGLGGGIALGTGAVALLTSADQTLYENMGDAAVGLAIGYPLGAALGTYLVGSSGDRTGSFWATLGGTVGGTLAGAAVLAGTQSWPGVALSLTISTGGGALGFQLTRRWERPPP